jgi:hypothetical protein
MLAHNERGSWFVTNGETVSSVSVRDNKSVVSLQKGVTNSGEYKICQEGSAEKTFTKLAGSVPTEVSDALGILPSGLNFSFQFDPPFLLKESGSSVALTLGNLTGVSRIFEAVREANRKRLAVNSLIKTRTADLSQVQEKLEEFVNLDYIENALSRAEDFYTKYLKLKEQSAGVKTLLEALLKHKKALSAVIVPEVPSLGDLQELLEKRARLRRLIFETKISLKQIAESSSQQDLAESEKRKIEIEYVQELEIAGRCPTCQQEIVNAGLS